MFSYMNYTLYIQILIMYKQHMLKFIVSFQDNMTLLHFASESGYNEVCSIKC